MKPKTTTPARRKSPRQKAAEAAARKVEQTVTADAVDDGAQAAPAPDTAQEPVQPPAANTAPDAPPRRKGKAKVAAPAPATDDAATDGGTGITIAELADRYLESLRGAGKGLGTQLSYSIDLQIAVKHFGETARVSTLTAQKLTNFNESDPVKKTRNGRPKASATIAKTQRILRLALVWGAAHGLLPSAPIPEKYQPHRGRKVDAATA